MCVRVCAMQCLVGLSCLAFLALLGVHILLTVAMAADNGGDGDNGGRSNSNSSQDAPQLMQHEHGQVGHSGTWADGPT